jgi:hypothetical protein
MLYELTAISNEGSLKSENNRTRLLFKSVTPANRVYELWPFRLVFDDKLYANTWRALFKVFSQHLALAIK